MAKKLTTSPKGIAVWPKLTTPDTKFDEAGVFQTKLRVPAQEGGETLAAQIDAAIQESVAAAKKLHPGKRIKQADAPYVIDEETGDYVFNMKRKASGVSKKTGQKWNAKVALFDAKGQPIKGVVKIGGGSTIKVSFEMSQFYTAQVGAGVTLRLEAVQLINLVEFGGRDAKGYGFGEEEGEYDASSASPEAEEVGFENEETAATAPSTAQDATDF